MRENAFKMSRGRLQLDYPGLEGLTKVADDDIAPKLHHLVFVEP